jgi:hypothetical protein
MAATAVGPLAAAWWFNRRTSLVHTVDWAATAWGAWTLTAFLEAGGSEQLACRYVSLCLTGCAGVAVLGARRPGVAAWDLVVAGLLIVLGRPMWEHAGPFPLETADRVFLALVLAVPLVNYLPTRIGPGMILLAVACVLEAAPLLGWPEPEWAGGVGAGAGWMAFAAWLSWLTWQLRLSPEVGTFDRLWLEYRDRFGLLWAFRIREQFNHAAAHAGWPVRLTWNGLQPPGAEPPEAMSALQAVLKRFAPPPA